MFQPPPMLNLLTRLISSACLAGKLSQRKYNATRWRKQFNSSYTPASNLTWSYPILFNIFFWFPSFCAFHFKKALQLITVCENESHVLLSKSNSHNFKEEKICMINMTSFQGVVCKPLSSSVEKHLYRSESGFMSKQENDQSATVKVIKLFT